MARRFIPTSAASRALQARLAAATREAGKADKAVEKARDRNDPSLDQIESMAKLAHEKVDTLRREWAAEAFLAALEAVLSDKPELSAEHQTRAQTMLASVGLNG